MSMAAGGPGCLHNKPKVLATSDQVSQRSLQGAPLPVATDAWLARDWGGSQEKEPKTVALQIFGLKIAGKETFFGRS